MITSLDKIKIYAIIDSLPDAFIARQFKQYISAKKQEIQESSLAEKINNLWNRIIGKTNKLTFKR